MPSAAESLRTREAAPRSQGFVVQLLDPCASDAAADCGRRAEANALAAAAGYARRAGDTLIVRRGRSAGSITLVDDTTEGDGYARYRYLGELPGLATDLVAATYYEGGAYLAVHRPTGDSLWLDAMPIIAPGLRRFAVASADNAAGDVNNRLTIISVGSDGLRREWQRETGNYVEGSGWGPTAAAWRDSTVLEFREQPVSGPNAPRDGQLVFRTGAWHLDESSPRN